MMKRTTEKGFTLIELMITIAIVGILAAVAIPSYQSYIIKAKVSEALTHFGPLKVQMAELYTVNNAFPSDTFMGFTHSDNHPVNWGIVNHFEWRSDTLNDVPRMWFRLELDKSVGIDSENESSSKRWIHLLALPDGNGGLTFKCGTWDVATHIDVKHLPASCQHKDLYNVSF